MSKPSALRSITTRPHWELPSEARRAKADVSDRLLAHFEDYHLGLRELKLSAREYTSEGPVARGVIQRFLLETEPDVAPEVDYETLARIVWLAAERYVRKTKNEVNFRLFLIGTQDGDPYKDDARFKLKPDQILADDPDDAQEEEARPTEDDDPDDFGDDEVPAAMVPVDERLAVSGERHAVPMQINPHFVVALHNSALSMAQKTYQGAMRSNLGLAEELRSQTHTFVEDIKAMAESNNAGHLKILQEIKALTLDLVEKGNKRIEVLEGRLNEHAKLNANQYKNLQLLSQQGWQAFLDGMNMKSQVAHERIEIADEKIRWSQRLLEEQSQAMASSGSGGPSLIKQAGSSPVVMAGLAMIMRKMGDDENASMFENLAQRFAGAPDADDGGEYEDEEPVGPNGNGRADVYDVTATEPAPSSAAPTPFADRARAFRASLDPETLDALRKLLPTPAWRAFEAACGAQDDSVAIRSLQTLEGFIRADNALMIGLAAQLDEDEVETIMGVIEDVRKVSGAARPAPPSRPPPAGAEDSAPEQT